MSLSFFALTWPQLSHTPPACHGGFSPTSPCSVSDLSSEWDRREKTEHDQIKGKHRRIRLHTHKDKGRNKNIEDVISCKKNRTTKNKKKNQAEKLNINFFEKIDRKIFKQNRSANALKNLTGKFFSQFFWTSFGQIYFSVKSFYDFWAPNFFLHFFATYRISQCFCRCLYGHTRLTIIMIML